MKLHQPQETKVLSKLLRGLAKKIMFLYRFATLDHVSRKMHFICRNYSMCKFYAFDSVSRAFQETVKDCKVSAPTTYLGIYSTSYLNHRVLELFSRILDKY